MQGMKVGMYRMLWNDGNGGANADNQGWNMEMWEMWGMRGIRVKIRGMGEGMSKTRVERHEI